IPVLSSQASVFRSCETVFHQPIKKFRLIPNEARIRVRNGILFGKFQGVVMSEGRNVLYKCRLQGRLFCLLLCVLAGLVSQAQSPVTTTVSDTVYRADGTPAAGTLLISWPAFTTASGQAVAAGTKSATLGAAGALSVALVPTASATPANTVYTVVYQLDDRTVKTEFWSVPTTSPTTVAAVRTILGSAGSANPPVTKQYVDAALASKADDSAVVHVSGAETISGTKQFAVSPVFPTPVHA